MTGSTNNTIDVSRASALVAPRATRGPARDSHRGRSLRISHTTHARLRAAERERRNPLAFLGAASSRASRPSRISFLRQRLAGSCRALDAARREDSGYRVGSASACLRVSERAEASAGLRFERRGARARPRVGAPRGRKVCQRGTHPTRIPPSVQARWRGKPPTWAPRTPRSREARRQWRRYARASAQTKVPTSPGLEPDARRDAPASRAKTSFRFFRRAEGW